MKYIRQILSILVLSLGAVTQTFGQAPSAPVQQPDQISQLAQMVGLSETQETEIRSILAEIEPEIESLQTEAQAIQSELVELAGPDFDEDAIRSKAAEFGQVQGKMTAASIILQSKVDAVFTEDQRNQLKEMQRQQRQQMQQIQQMQMQQQMQQMQPE
jgi:hypothetical protein